MNKKLAALAGAGALLFTMAGPALGFLPMFGSDDLNIDNWAFVSNKVTTKADSGDNSVGGMFVCGGGITTGAARASALVMNDVNSSMLGCPTCFDDVNIDNGAMVFNRTYTKADSGDNSVGGMVVGGGWINTGGATAGSTVQNLVNFSWVNGPMTP